MPLTVTLPHDSKAIELDEFNEIVRQNNYDLNRLDEILDLARYFQQLNNHKTFLPDRLCEQLKSIGEPWKKNSGAPNAFILDTQAHYLIRAVI